MKKKKHNSNIILHKIRLNSSKADSSIHFYLYLYNHTWRFYETCRLSVKQSSNWVSKIQVVYRALIYFLSFKFS